MDQREIQIVANRSLIALNDNRTMVAVDTTDTLTDLKNILRQLVNGQLILVDAPRPEANAESNDNE